jgi:hypothetical protein
MVCFFVSDKYSSSEHCILLIVNPIPKRPEQVPTDQFSSS